MEPQPGSRYIGGMDKKLKRPRDPSQLAKMMVDIASGDVAEKHPAKKKPRSFKAGPKPKKKKK